MNLNNIYCIFELNSSRCKKSEILEYLNKFSSYKFKKLTFISGENNIESKIYHYLDIYNNSFFPGKILTEKPGIFNRLFSIKYYDDIFS